VNRAHLIDEDRGAELLDGLDAISEDCLDFVLAAAERYDDIRVIVNMEVDGLAGMEIDFPNPHVLVFKYDALADFAQLNAAFRRFGDSKFIGHTGCLRAHFGSTAMALISIK